MSWKNTKDELPKQIQSNKGVLVIGVIGETTRMEMVFDEGNFYSQGSIILNVNKWMLLPDPKKEYIEVSK